MRESKTKSKKRYGIQSYLPLRLEKMIIM